MTVPPPLNLLTTGTPSRRTGCIWTSSETLLQPQTVLATWHSAQGGQCIIQSILPVRSKDELILPGNAHDDSRRSRTVVDDAPVVLSAAQEPLLQVQLPQDGDAAHRDQPHQRASSADRSVQARSIHSQSETASSSFRGAFPRTGGARLGLKSLEGSKG